MFVIHPVVVLEVMVSTHHRDSHQANSSSFCPAHGPLRPSNLSRFCPRGPGRKTARIVRRAHSCSLRSHLHTRRAFLPRRARVLPQPLETVVATRLRGRVREACRHRLRWLAGRGPCTSGKGQISTPRHRERNGRSVTDRKNRQVHLWVTKGQKSNMRVKGNGVSCTTL